MNDRKSRSPAIFCDRDGTLIEEVGFLADLERMRLLPGVAEAVGAANRAGLPVVVVSNQSGVARGRFSEDFAKQSGRHLEEMLARQGAHLDAYYFCPHHPEGQPPFNTDCRCRKPKHGLLKRAERELSLSLRGAYMIGDKESDLETGVKLGVVSILVRTGYGGETKLHLPSGFASRGGRVFDDFPAAVAWIIGGLPAPG